MEATEKDIKVTDGQRKVFVLGLDGATFDLMDPLIKQGELPNLAAIIKEGVRAKMNSTIPHHSAPAWTSFATGKNPGKHGILGFTKMLPNSYKLALVYGSDNKAKPLWDVAGDTGKNVIVVNIPMTFPPRPVNGLLLSGLDAPSTSANFTYPRELREEILKVCPDYKINLHLGGYLQSERKRIKAVDMIMGAIKARLKVVLYLMERYPWDLFSVRFNAPDNVQHQFWKFMDKNHPLHREDSPALLKSAIRSVYKELDKVVGRIHEELEKEKTALIIMSDHGAGPNVGKCVYVNEWLKSLGYFAGLGEDANRRFSGLRGMGVVCKGKLISFLLRTIPPEVKGMLLKFIPFAASKTATHLKFSGISWERTKAFVSEVEGIRINLKGKYPSGTVEASEYESLRETIIDEASGLCDPDTGEPVFEQVLKREQVYSGDSVDEFPDIILRPDDRYNLSPKLLGKKAAENGFLAREQHWRKISGSHRQHGIFIITGPDCKRGVQLDEIQIADILPTALYQMGVPLPDDLDGQAIGQVFQEEFLKANPLKVRKAKEYEAVERGEIYSDEDKSKLVDSLRGLGYIE
jgi:predicted AlkP superfamily phosphohydrolase/phosphomutase